MWNRLLKPILRCRPDRNDMFLLSGIAFTSFGAYQIYPPAGSITLGVLLLAIAWVTR